MRGEAPEENFRGVSSLSARDGSGKAGQGRLARGRGREEGKGEDEGAELQMERLDDANFLFSISWNLAYNSTKWPFRILSVISLHSIHYPSPVTPQLPQCPRHLRAGEVQCHLIEFRRFSKPWQTEKAAIHSVYGGQSWSLSYSSSGP